MKIFSGLTLHCLNFRILTTHLNIKLYFLYLFLKNCLLSSTLQRKDGDRNKEETIMKSFFSPFMFFVLWIVNM